MHEFNLGAYKVYCQVSNQYLSGAGGATAINQLAIHKVLDCYNLPYDEDRLEIINKVEIIANSCLKVQHEDAERKRKAAQKR